MTVGKKTQMRSTYLMRIQRKVIQPVQHNWIAAHNRLRRIERISRGRA